MFPIVGPGVGTAVAYLFLGRSDFGGGWLNPGIFFGMGYVLGAPPALITGMISSWFVGRVKWAFWMRAAALAGAGVSFVAGGIFSLLIGTANLGAAIFMSAIFSAAGAAAAYVSAGAAWVLLMATLLSPDRPQPGPPA